MRQKKNGAAGKLHLQGVLFNPQGMELIRGVGILKNNLKKTMD